MSHLKTTCIARSILSRRGNAAIERNRTVRVLRGIASVILLSANPTIDIQPALAQETISREYTIKAGIVGILSKCVVWPEVASPTEVAPLRIGIVGRDPFMENGTHQLERVVAEERAKGTKITLLHFDSATDYQPCQILFVSNQATELSEEQTVAERLDAVKEVTAGQSVLIVAESEGMTQRGAVANLLFDRNTNLIHLELNPDAAARTGLRLEPDLLRLKLVRIVRDSKE